MHCIAITSIATTHENPSEVPFLRVNLNITEVYVQLMVDQSIIFYF